MAWEDFIRVACAPSPLLCQYQGLPGHTTCGICKDHALARTSCGCIHVLPKGATPQDYDAACQVGWQVSKEFLAQYRNHKWDDGMRTIFLHKLWAAMQMRDAAKGTQCAKFFEFEVLLEDNQIRLDLRVQDA